MSAIADRIVLLSRSLRARGVSVSLAETVDAVEAAASIGLGDRSLLREALRSTMCKVADERGEFDRAFDRCFPVTHAVRARPIDLDATDLLAQAVGGDGDLGEIAAALVDAHGGLDGDTRGERHHIQRVLRAADLATLMSLALRDLGEATPDEVRARIDELKRLIASEVRERLGAPDDVPMPETQNIEFLNASRAELEAMRNAVRPLARRIATRLARRRQHQRTGRVNLRRTMRRSLASGGVPIDVAHQRPRPQYPELWVLCDISGSVAEFSLFTLTLVSALSAELPRTRSFVFVDAIDEITALLEHTGHGIEPWQILRNTNVIGVSGHSDYGTVLQQFWDGVGERALTSRSTVVIAGDGRSNHQPARSDVLATIARRARAVYWLNPERTADWTAGDSEMDAYAEHCTRVFEVRDLHQLAHCVETIL
jgi:uncharacterized protein with von Willebrand factor type A (vWA) domain